MDMPGRQQKNKGPRYKGAAMSRKQEGSQQDCQKDFCTGGCEASSWDFHWFAEYEWLGIVEGSAPSKTKEGTAHCVRAEDKGALATLGSSAHSDQNKDGSKRIWTNWHLMMELLRMWGLKEGAAGATED
jgi:hypothetical protein